MPFSTYASAGLALLAIVAMILLLRVGALRTAFGRQHAGRSDLMRVEHAITLDGSRRKVTMIHVAGRSVLVMTGGPTDLVLGWVDQQTTATAP